MKKLRAKLKRKVRYYYCGEYGEKFQRPHYHILLFGHDFKDKQLLFINNGSRIYKSQELEQIWGHGFCTIGDVTFESAAYVSRYILKKITGKKAEDHYTVIDEDTGEIIKMQNEFTDMSRRPGIAKTWWDKHKTDVYPDDFIVLNNKKMKPPKYYSKRYEIEYPEDSEKIKTKQKQDGWRKRQNSTCERLQVREKIQLTKLKQLKRGYENET